MKVLYATLMSSAFSIVVRKNGGQRIGVISVRAVRDDHRLGGVDRPVRQIGHKDGTARCELVDAWPFTEDELEFLDPFAGRVGGRHGRLDRGRGTRTIGRTSKGRDRQAMRDIRDDARDGFADAFGHTAAGLWSAPGRVNLIGEHTDYNNGFVLPFAINRRTVVAVGARDDRMLRVASSYADEVAEIDLADLKPDALHDWSAYPLGVAWALSEFGGDLAAVPGLDLFIESDVPVGAGLSSSAAIESAVAIALNDVWQLGLSRETLARVGQRAENVAVGAPTGIMDQSASLLGRAGAATFPPRSPLYRPVGHVILL